MLSRLGVERLTVEELGSVDPTGSLFQKFKRRLLAELGWGHLVDFPEEYTVGALQERFLWHRTHQCKPYPVTEARF
jgi:hypothetical protein